jgi:hypothetical protein
MTTGIRDSYTYTLIYTRTYYILAACHDLTMMTATHITPMNVRYHDDNYTYIHHTITAGVQMLPLWEAVGSSPSVMKCAQNRLYEQRRIHSCRKKNKAHLASVSPPSAKGRRPPALRTQRNETRDATLTTSRCLPTLLLLHSLAASRSRHHSRTATTRILRSRAPLVRTRSCAPRRQKCLEGAEREERDGRDEDGDLEGVLRARAMRRAERRGVSTV